MFRRGPIATLLKRVGLANPYRPPVEVGYWTDMHAMLVSCPDQGTRPNHEHHLRGAETGLGCYSRTSQDYCIVDIDCSMTFASFADSLFIAA